MNVSEAHNQVVQSILRDVARREAVVSFQEIKARSRAAPSPRDAVAALAQKGCSVIAEIKRRSPVFGPTGVGHESVAHIALQIEQAGAQLIACQTERLRFGGSLIDLENARNAVQLPMICRDVIVDPYQIHEARCFGADAIPLQVGILEQARLESLLDRAESLEMAVLAEVRTPEEADRALRAGARIIAVNSWTFATNDLHRGAFGEIAPGLPREVLKISLGGVRCAADLFDAAAAGADAVLAAEGIMGQEDVYAATRALVAAGQHPSCAAHR